MISWQEIVGLCEQRHFGDLVIEPEDGHLRRGPISAMRIITPKGDDVDGRERVTINTLWMGVRRHDGTWDNARVRGSQTIVTTISIKEQPENAAEAICVRVGGVGKISLLLRASEKSLLDPTKVFGINDAELRMSMAHQYGLPLYTVWDEVMEAIPDPDTRITLRYARGRCARAQAI